MRNIILQHFTGKLRTLDKLSVENISAYAERIGVEYQFVEGQVFREHLTPPCQKLHILDEKWDEYDDVLMLDIDMFVTKNLRLNVFKAEGVGLFADVQKRLKNRLVQHGRIESESAYFGGAIYKLTKQQRQSLRDGIPEDNSWMDPYNEAYQFEDEGIMSELFHRTDTQWSNLDQKWCQDSYMPEHKAGMIHVRTKIKPEGPKREKIDNFYDLQMRGVI
jgi:hypothetical protein|tara:strand:- start:431 stop:1087 length:657 start_codon:yes stop_codon:yes gene_type:complete